MIDHQIKSGVVAATSDFKNQTRINYTLPAQYRKPIRYWIDQEVVTFRGKQAFVLDQLINAKPGAMEHSSTMHVVSALRDVVRHLKIKGVRIRRQRKQNTVYFLLSDVARWEART